MAKIRSRDVATKCDQILSDLKNKIYHPVYLLMGEEPFYIDKISGYISENALAESEKAFNQLILYGKDTDARSIIFAAARPPMMAKYQVVIVKEAQNLIAKDTQKGKSDDLEVFERYCREPLSSTILVLCCKGKTLDKRTKLYKELEKKAVILETVKLYDNEIAEWISNYLRQKGASINPAAASVLAEHIGADLSRIVNELDKLFILLPENNKTVTTEHIEKNIGISKEYNTFELGNALFTKNVLKANRIVNYFGKNPNNNPMILTIASISSQFLKLLKYHAIKRNNRNVQPREIASILGVDPFFLREYEAASAKYNIIKVVQVIELLREYDMKSKGWDNAGISDEELLKELVFKIIH
ncbi:MAG: DNA polymerase III subunit delta [Prevotellaceae bacterium]|jgi:DNA polymerase-3 subunit delta|nr:DNA polymerase III subunit delta [Prevotellaceae bacterium]